jgi:hypothetical protein
VTQPLRPLDATTTERPHAIIVEHVVRPREQWLSCTMVGSGCRLNETWSILERSYAIGTLSVADGAPGNCNGKDEDQPRWVELTVSLVLKERPSTGHVME